MTTLKIVKTVFLNAPPEHVWRFLTEKDRLALWFHQGSEDLREGGDYVLVSNTLGQEGQRCIWGKILEFDPPRRLVHTFTHEYLNDVETTCTWTLTAVEEGTVLRLEHAGFENVDFNMGSEHDRGWDEFFIRLRRVTS